MNYKVGDRVRIINKSIGCIPFDRFLKDPQRPKDINNVVIEKVLDSNHYIIFGKEGIEWNFSKSDLASTFKAKDLNN